MIIHKETKSVETLASKPNENFGNYENVFIIDDNSDLGKKILASQPYFEFVINNGELVDVTPTMKPPEPPKPPTAEERIEALELAMLTIMG